MKALNNQEKKLLLIDKFFEKLKSEFDSISYVSISIPNLEEKENRKYYKPKNNIYPLIVKVTHKDKSSVYHWRPDESDDEYPLYDKYGFRYGFYDVRDFIKENLPEAFISKIFYKEENFISTSNINEMLDPIKKKMEVIYLEKELIKKRLTNKPRLKI